MLGKRTRPVIKNLPTPLTSSNRTGFTDSITSPKSPLDFKIRSPRGLKNCDMGGVGLGIVAALEKSGEIPMKFIVGNLNLNRSDPIPITIGSAKTSAKFRGGLEENYTCVTSHGPNKSITRVYCDGVEDINGGHDSVDNKSRRNLGVFYNSPQRFAEAIPVFPTSDFLSSCYLCRKKLHGKDIYMYRGDKAFCSTECRYRQIVSDERKEKCRSEASISSDISVSPYSGLFSTGITAA